MDRTVGDIVHLIEDLQLRIHALDILRGQVEVQTAGGPEENPWSLFDESTTAWLIEQIRDVHEGLNDKVKELKSIPLPATTSPKKGGRPKRKGQ